MRIYIDESEKDDIYNVGLITTSDYYFCTDKIKEKVQNILHDLKLGLIPTVGSLATVGPHYTQDHIDIKNEFISLFKQLPFECYIAFSRSKGDRRQLHLKLLESILSDRLLKFKTKAINIIHEENSIFSINSFKTEIHKLTTRLEQEYSLSSKLNIDIEIKGKTADLNLSIIDYMIGVFRDYYTCEMRNASYQYRNFKTLRQKYRVIYNLDTRERDTRKHRIFL